MGILSVAANNSLTRLDTIFAWLPFSLGIFLIRKIREGGNCPLPLLATALIYQWVTSSSRSRPNNTLSVNNRQTESLLLETILYLCISSFDVDTRLSKLLGQESLTL